MNNFNYPLRVSKINPPPFRLYEINDGTEKEEENIENNPVCRIDPQKAVAIRLVPRSVF